MVLKRLRIFRSEPPAHPHSILYFSQGALPGKLSKGSQHQMSEIKVISTQVYELVRMRGAPAPQLRKLSVFSGKRLMIRATLERKHYIIMLSAGFPTLERKRFLLFYLSQSVLLGARPGVCRPSSGFLRE